MLARESIFISGQKVFQVDKITDFAIVEHGKGNRYMTSTAARWPEEVFARLRGVSGVEI